jgi:succinyl-CoA synthetase beta subunit
MNIHEYQAKKILSEHGINIPAGQIAYTPAEAKRAALKLSARGPWMLKAQIQSGARASGHFISHDAGHKGGIRMVTKISNIAYETAQMLNNVLVTEQTGPKGKPVNKVYVEAFRKIKRSFYAGVVINSSISAITLLISGVVNRDIVNIATAEQSKILSINLFAGEKIAPEQIKQIISFLDLDDSYYEVMADFIAKLLRTFIECDAKMIEINPVGITREKTFFALDAKITFDENALFRHPDIARLRDDYEEDERVLKASMQGFQYSEFDGNIGCIVNGDGLALEAMDILKSRGYETACFLNVRGGVEKDKIAAGIKIIMTNPRVEGILINILGGFLRCNLVADGILAATQELGLTMPLVARLEGTAKNEAKAILEQSGLPILFADNTTEAVEQLIERMEVNS